MASHSSVLAWRIPGTGESGELPSMGVAQGRTRLKQLSNSSSSGNERRVEILYTVASFTGGGGLGNCVLLSYVAISIKTGTLDFPSGQVVKPIHWNHDHKTVQNNHKDQYPQKGW